MLRLAIGRHRRIGLLAQRVHVSEHGVAAAAHEARAVRPTDLDQPAEGDLGLGEAAVAQMQDAHQHLCLGILRRQLGGVRVGAQRIGRVVEQRERTELPPIGDRAAVERGRVRPVAVHAPAQQLLGLGAVSSRLLQHRARDRLDVALEGLARAHGRSCAAAFREQSAGLRQPQSELLPERIRLALRPRRPHRRHARAAGASAGRGAPRPADDECGSSHHGFARAGLAEPGGQDLTRPQYALLEPPPLHASPTTSPGPRAPRVSLGQWNELFLVARHEREPLGSPVLLRLPDPLLRGGHEIPPDVTRTVHGIAAEQHQPRLRCS